MADLKIRISAVTQGLKAGLAGAKGAFQRFGSFVRRNFIGITAIITGAVVAINRFAEAADQIGKAAKRLGISVQEFQKLTFAAERTGAEMGDVEKGFRRMQRVVNDAGNELSSAKRTLDQLGLSFDKLSGKSGEQQFKIIAKALSEITDKQKQAAVAQELFGRSGTKIAALASEYENLSEMFKVLGGGLTEDAIKASESYEDSITNLKTSFKSLVSQSGIIVFFESMVIAINKSILGYQALFGVISAFNKGGIDAALIKIKEERVRLKKFEESTKNPDFSGVNNSKKSTNNLPPRPFVGSPLQALSGDKSLAVGGMLTPLSGMATTPELTELQKQTRLLEAIRNSRGQAWEDNTTKYWQNELENTFKDGS